MQSLEEYMEERMITHIKESKHAAHPELKEQISGHLGWQAILKQQHYSAIESKALWPFMVDDIDIYLSYLLVCLSSSHWLPNALT